MNRDDVYKLIDGERRYQDLRYGQTKSMDRSGRGERSIDEFAVYIKAYSDELIHISRKQNVRHEKLEIVRKIAALAVACMEQHGGSERERAIAPECE